MQAASITSDPLFASLSTATAAPPGSVGTRELEWLAAWNVEAVSEVAALPVDAGFPPAQQAPGPPVETPLRQIFPLRASLFPQNPASAEEPGIVPQIDLDIGIEELEDIPVELPAEPPALPLVAHWTVTSFVPQPVETPAPAPSSPQPPPELASGRQAIAHPDAAPAPALEMTKGPKDKGESVWTADFEVVERQASQFREPQVKAPSAAAEPALSPEQAAGANSGKQGESNGERRENPNPKMTEGPNQEARPEPQPASKESERPAPEPKAIKKAAAPEQAQGNVLAPVEAPAPPTAAPPSDAPAPVEAVQATEPARPLRTGQVTSVQVDLRQPGVPQSDDPALRLVVTQRGDQVAVRVRSWDNTVNPIPAEQMQPLIESLAADGFVAQQPELALEAAVGVPAAEVPIERPLAAADSSQLSNDNRSSGQFDERQERRQEQQRQQQQFFNRRQPSNQPRFRMNEAATNGR